MLLENTVVELSSSSWEVRNLDNKEFPIAAWFQPTIKGYKGRSETSDRYISRIIKTAEEIKQSNGHVFIYNGAFVFDFLEADDNNGCKNLLYRACYPKEKFEWKIKGWMTQKCKVPTTVTTTFI